MGVDLSALLALDRFLLIINYFALAGSFIYAYFKPQENTEWLVVGAVNYMWLMIVSLFLLSFTMWDYCCAPCMVIWIFIFLYIVKRLLVLLEGRTWIFPFALFVFSIAQEIWHALALGKDGSAPIVIWYFGGVIIVMVVSVPLGDMLDRRFPRISELHLLIMRQLFGPGAPGRLVFKDGSMASGNFTPGVCAAMGVLYAIWMLLRFVILPL